MAWNLPGPSRGRPGKPDRPAPRPTPPDDEPPGLDEVLRRLGDFFGTGLEPGRVLLLALAALVFVYGSLGFHQVQEGEQAVVLRNGRLLGVQDPGLHWNPPVVDTWRTLQVARLREATLGTEVISADEDLVAVTLTLRYRIGNVRDYLLGFDDGEAEMLRAAESFLQQAAARMSAAELNGPGQRVLVATLQDQLAAHLHDTRSGLVLAGASLAGVTPPAAIDAAVAEVERTRADMPLQLQKAHDDAAQALKRTQAEAQRLVATAAQDKARAIQQAQADAARLTAAIAAAHDDPAGTRRRLYEEAVADVMARTRTVVVGEPGLEKLGIPADKLATPSPLPPAPPSAPGGGRP